MGKGMAAYIQHDDDPAYIWHMPYIRKLSEALHKLSRLRILERKENILVMNDTFRQEFKCALTGG